jgi:hypothetical protein
MKSRLQSSYLLSKTQYFLMVIWFSPLPMKVLVHFIDRLNNIKTD